ncbi:MAG TPA: carboxypeptidase-like regulatory domain-containing protein, partial [Acidobacteriota bacterium]|nr:carboxypeptidase-like regulatory domain-containing protein [Acidobacteriota bacterium]
MNKAVQTKRGFLSLVLCAAAVLVMAAGAFPQATQVTLEGTLVDEQGNALPGAAVGIRNLETGYLYSAVSRPNGTYAVSGIQPGTYEVDVKLAGFATQKKAGMVFNVGARVTINFTLKPSTLQEELTVTAAAPMIEISKSEVSSVVDRQKIDDVPLLDRNFASLVVLKAGVQEDSRSNAMSRGNEEILIDGVSNEWVGTNITRASVPADAIEEFRVLTNQFQAEYGNSTGMIMSAISRSGTNTLRGRASFFYRDQAFDAVNYFVNHATYKGPKLPKDDYEKTKFDHYNYSAFLGGPIVKDKAHFFLAYEGLNQNAYATITSPLVPNETIKQPSVTHQVVAKFNYQLNEKNLLTFRYTLNRLTEDNQGPGGLYTKELAYKNKNNVDDFQANWTWFPSDNTINELRVLHSRSDSSLIAPDLNKYFIARPSGYFGKIPNIPQTSIENRTQIVDNFSMFLGDHNVKLGLDYSNVPMH